MYKKRKLIGLLLGSMVACVACGHTNATDTVVTSNIGNITKAELSSNLKEQFGKLATYQMMANKVLLHKYPISDKEMDTKIEEIKKQSNKTLLELAQQLGLASENKLKEQLKVQAALEKAVKESVTEKDIKDQYKSDIKIKKIIVDKEEVANEIVAKLKNGGDFAEVIKSYPNVSSSKQQDNDIGWIPPGTLPVELEKAVYQLKVGEYSSPLKVNNGYAIIQMIEQKELPPFDQAKEDIRKKLEVKRLQDQQWQQQFFKDLFKQVDIKITDKDLKDTFKEFLK
ncbi:peptidylprolyl isomerase [Bacillus thuringiensis]|uniref:Foldase protein PrsA n=1 Tax=Bacillus thuringiensis Bt18247 TaxID=1423143 RepID=A0A9W3XBZ7_BACTU|nr:peptidylprolyl isomerase [Bacillus thuringiensis]AOM14389.1 foldase protein prsA 3 [Bacillus thuringiensis Bt18247]AOM14490.1 foldase protein prsA 3 [Bacillus thuringiensis Bt18247]MBG9525824.1 hypothetical protein [Bacillus thuringiensis]